MTPGITRSQLNNWTLTSSFQDSFQGTKAKEELIAEP